MFRRGTPTPKVGVLKPPPRDHTPPWEQTPREQTPQDQTPPRSRHPHPPPEQTPAYGQRAAGTHPTGMHSWFNMFFFLEITTHMLTPFASWRVVTPIPTENPGTILVNCNRKKLAPHKKKLMILKRPLVLTHGFSWFHAFWMKTSRLGVERKLYA